MTDELRIWTLRDGNEVEAVESVSGVKLEDILEATLVSRPEMLENGLQLVGRQTPTEGGPLDLLGVDEGGRLVVFELKRERLTREAVTQCIDYASALDDMAPEELAEFIAEHSGSDGIQKIEDFDEWYQERFDENELKDLLPPRLTLVGLGVDERAERMAQFLKKGGIDISVLTFYGFEHGRETLLARQVEVERNASEPTGRRTYLSAAEKRLAFQNRLDEQGLVGLFEAVDKTLRTALPDAAQRYGSYGVNYHLPVGSNRRRFCHLWVENAGLTVRWYPESYYSPDALDSLRAEAVQCGWRAVRDDREYALSIDSTEQWDERRDGLVRFIKAALRSWNPTPQSGNFRELLWAYVRDVPQGRVVTYGQIADALNSPEAAQAVGGAMRALPDETDVPWHRVVTATGQLGAPDSPDEQRERLRDEGVLVSADDRVDLDKYQWNGQKIAGAVAEGIAR
ncbi:MAG: DUF91 domain-containing protein [Chloroflexi bacterium]|nr:DUF91 domain-containing protein [Chloroflexota bacterium]